MLIAPACWQVDTDIFMSEDCLFLNLFVPVQPSKEKTGYPVIVYLHFGSFTEGFCWFDFCI
jgi:carboxylesterase type B